MYKSLFTILALFIMQSIHSQQNYSVGFSFGIGKNYFNNEYETNSSHFSFKAPMTINLGTQFVKIINSKNHIVAQLNYISKKVRFEYELNESEIPYNVIQTVTDNFDCFSLAIGYRRPVQINNIKFFAQIDFAADYNINVSQSNSGSGTGTNTEINEEILYWSFLSNNLGQESIVLGSNIAFGAYLGKTNRSEISIGLNIPFSNIQDKTSNLQYLWSYESNDYFHNLNYKGGIIYPSLKYTYNVFNK